MDRIDVKRLQVLDALGSKTPALLTVGQVMTAGPSRITPDTTALELAKMFHAKRFRHLLVTDEKDKLIGVISDRDVIRCFGPTDTPDQAVLSSITAQQIMSSDLVTVGPNTPVERAVTLMIDQGISCLPVMADESLLGILTATDLHVVLHVLLQTVRQACLEESIAAGGSVSDD